MKRKLLFLVFTNDVCKLYHAFIYSLDLKENGHKVKMILEGGSTKRIKELCENDGPFKKLLNGVKSEEILVGACKAASHGCGDSASSSIVSSWMTASDIPLLADLEGHAGIAYLVEQGYEVITF